MAMPECCIGYLLTRAEYQPAGFIEQAVAAERWRIA
jgi:hypothetical protein